MKMVNKHIRVQIRHGGGRESWRHLQLFRTRFFRESEVIDWNLTCATVQFQILQRVARWTNMLHEAIIQSYLAEMQSFEAPWTRAQSLTPTEPDRICCAVVFHRATEPSCYLSTAESRCPAPINMQPEWIQLCNVATEHRVRGEILRSLYLSLPLCFLLSSVEARHGVPEVPPPLGQHACLNRLPGLHEGHDDMDEAVRLSGVKSLMGREAR
jgi:hypothetical protein